MTRSTSMLFVVSRLQEELSRLLHEAMALEAGAPLEEPEPRLDILETDEALVVLAEVPGIDPGQVRLEVHQSSLVLHANKSGGEPSPEARFHRVECSRGELERRINLPRGFDPARARAELRDGLLRIEVPRRRVDESAPRVIPIEHPEESTES
jgi:HSP20 family protein